MRSQDDGPAGRRIPSSCCTVRRRHRRAAATALSSCRKRPSFLILVPVSAQLPTLSHRSKRRLWFLRNLKAGAALVGLGCLYGVWHDSSSPIFERSDLSAFARAEQPAYRHHGLESSRGQSFQARNTEPVWIARRGGTRRRALSLPVGPWEIRLAVSRTVCRHSFLRAEWTADHVAAANRNRGARNGRPAQILSPSCFTPVAGFLCGLGHVPVGGPVCGKLVHVLLHGRLLPRFNAALQRPDGRLVSGRGGEVLFAVALRSGAHGANQAGQNLDRSADHATHLSFCSDADGISWLHLVRI